MNAQQTAIAAVQKEFDRLNKQLDASLAEPGKKIDARLPDVDQFNWSLFKTSFGKSYSIGHRARCYFSSRSDEQPSGITREFANKVLAQYAAAYRVWKDACAPVLAEVDAVIEHNKTQRERVAALMARIGIHPTVVKYEYKTARSKTATRTETASGYVADLNRVYPVSFTAYKDMCNKIDSKRRELAQFSAEAVERCRKEQAAKEKAERDAQAVHKLAVLRVKYNVSIDTSACEILSLICNQDKYLELAHAMQETRNDWSDGFYRVEDALAGFTVETDFDRALVEDLTKILDSGEDDGRVFRDCEYNYNVLFKMVSTELSEDYVMANSLVD